MEASESCLSSLDIPLVDQTLSINSEDGRIGSVDERLELLGHARFFDFNKFALGDILPDANDADDNATQIPSRRGVEQHIDAFAIFREERKLKVGG